MAVQYCNTLIVTYPLALSEDSNEKEFLLPDSFSRNQIRAVEGLLLDYNGLLFLEKDSDSNAIKVVKKSPRM